jgi:hypothetical protein
MAEVAIPRQMFQEILRLIAELRPQPPQRQHETFDSQAFISNLARSPMTFRLLLNGYTRGSAGLDCVIGSGPSSPEYVYAKTGWDLAMSVGIGRTLCLLAPRLQLPMDYLVVLRCPCTSW